MRSDRRRKLILLGLALLAFLILTVMEQAKVPAKQGDYELKLAAAEKAAAAIEASRRYCARVGLDLDPGTDPARTGLIGPDSTAIVNDDGVLESKQTALNPNWAAILIEYFQEIGLEAGDSVAVALSGSFPAMNLCIFAALEAMDLAPRVITSVGASGFGATHPDYTWLDMEQLFIDEGIFRTRSVAASFGGSDDMGGRRSNKRVLREVIERHDVELLSSASVEEAIEQRMNIYQVRAGGEPYRAYINVGGGVASLGSGVNKSFIPLGLNTELEEVTWTRKGAMIRMAEMGVPFIHLIKLREFAAQVDLPVAPDYLPHPGEGELFIRNHYRISLAIPFLVLYCATCVLVLAPELRRGLFDRWSGRVDGDTV